MLQIRPVSDLRNKFYIKFYQCFPDEQIVNACVHNLNWTHIRSSVLHDNDRLFMSKYLTYLPTKEQLKAEIERAPSITNE